MLSVSSASRPDRPHVGEPRELGAAHGHADDHVRHTRDGEVGAHSVPGRTERRDRERLAHDGSAHAGRPGIRTGEQTAGRRLMAHHLEEALADDRDRDVATGGVGFDGRLSCLVVRERRQGLGLRPPVVGLVSRDVRRRTADVHDAIGRVDAYRMQDQRVEQRRGGAERSDGGAE